MRGRLHAITGICLIDRFDRGLKAHIHADCMKCLHQPTDKIGVEAVQQALAMLEDGHLCASAGSNM